MRCEKLLFLSYLVIAFTCFPLFPFLSRLLSTPLFHFFVSRLFLSLCGILVTSFVVDVGPVLRVSASMGFSSFSVHWTSGFLRFPQFLPVVSDDSADPEMDVQYFFLFHWVIELTSSFGAHQPGGEFLNFFLVLWRMLHSSSLCERLLSPSSPWDSGSHHFGIFGPIIYVCLPGGAVHTTGFGPVGVFPRLAQRIPPSIRAVSPSSWPMSPPHVYENEAQPAARSPEPSPLHPLLHDVWPVRFGLFVLYRGCRLDGLRRSSGSSRSLTARVACSVSSLLALHSILSFTLLKAWSRARRMDCPAAKRITSHTLPPMSSSIA